MSHFIDALLVGAMGFATTGYQLDTVGHMLVRGRADMQLATAGDTAPFVRLIGNGVNGAQTEVYTGSRDPNGVVSALPGSIYLRQSGVSSDIYVNNSVGPGAGTAWAASTLGADTWAAVLAAGNVSGGTDAVMTNGDEFRFIDGAAVTRRSDDLAAGEPRTRYFTAAAALASTLSVATATGVLTYTDDFVLASPNATETIGDAGGSPGLNAAKAEAGEFSFGVFSAGFPRWAPAYVPSDETMRSSRYDALGVLVNFPWVLQNPATTTTLNDSLISLASPNVLEDLGDDTGSPSRRSRKSDGGQTLDRWYSNGIERFLGRLDVAETQSLEHYSAAAALDAIVSFTANTITFGAVDTLIAMTAPDVVVQLGNNTGTQPQLQLRAAAASSNYFSHYQGSVRVWDTGQTHNDSNWYVDRFVGGAFTDSTSVSNAAHLWTYPGSSTWASANPVRNFGNALGTPVDNINKADASNYFRVFYNALGSRWVERFQSDEILAWERRDLAEATVNFPLVFNAATTAATTATSISDALINLDYANVIGTWGAGTGTVTNIWNKLDAGSVDLSLRNQGIERFGWRLRADELHELNRRDAAGGFVNTAILWNAAATAATTSTTIGDASTVWGYVDPYLQVGGTTTALWTVDYIKDDAGQGGWNLYNEAVRRFAFSITTAENTQMASFSAAAALLTLIQFQSATDNLLFCFTPSPLVTMGDMTGSPVFESQKADAGFAIRRINSAGVTRFIEHLNPAEELHGELYTAAPALDTVYSLIPGGFFRIQTHWGVTDATTLPAALAGYAKFAMDSAANGRPKLVEGDGSIEQLGAGINSEAMPVVDREFSDVTVANTVVETDIFNFPIPANTLGIRGGLRLVIEGDIHHEGTAQLQVRAYLGATTLYDSTSPILTATTEDDAGFWLELVLPNRGATNAQRGGVKLMISAASNAGPAGALGGDMGNATPQVDTCGTFPATTVDTTAAQTLRVTVTWSAAALTNSFVRRSAYLTCSPAA